jgi:prophage regulatory protein
VAPVGPLGIVGVDNKPVLRTFRCGTMRSRRCWNMLTRNAPHYQAEGTSLRRTPTFPWSFRRNGHRNPSKVASHVESYLIGLEGKPGAALLAASVRDVLVRITDVCAITGLSVPTLYRLMNQSRFPRPLKITSTARAWKLREITAWVDSRPRGEAHCGTIEAKSGQTRLAEKGPAS